MNYEYNYYKELDSTQDELRRWVDQYPDLESGRVIVADFQNNGKGQRGNFWESKSGENLTFSLYMKPHNWPATDSFLLSQIVSLAIVDMIDAHIQEPVYIKWPNDIYIAESKVAGILIENSLTGEGVDYSIIGIGLNLNQTTFDSDAPNPISLHLITGQRYDREVILGQLLERLDYYLLSDMDIHRIGSLYMKKLYRMGEWSDYQDINGSFRGRIVEVDRQGVLQVERYSGQIDSFSFKEIRFK